MLVPSAFTVPTGSAHWHTLLRGMCAYKRIIPPLLSIVLYHGIYSYTQLISFKNPCYPRSCFCILARAIEHQCYVLAAAQYGRHNTKRESYGHSLAVDPWGQIVADAGGYDGPGTTTTTTTTTTASSDPSSAVVVGKPAPSVIFCDIDLEQIESIRQRMPIQQHRDSSSFAFLK